MTTQPGDEIKSASEKPLEPPAEIPANPAETPITVPIDDPEIVVRGEKDYSNSLNALLKKYMTGSKEK